jgi:amidohydrolase
MSLQDSFAEHVQTYCQTAYALNHQIAHDPELSGEEYHACAAYVKACRDLGMTVEEEFNGQKTAFRAIVRRSAKPVLKVALLAEYDALPDIGHGCGHSANGAMSFLAAAALHQLPDFPVDVDLIGTPDEELRGGKVAMCRNNIFRDYDLAMMVHVSPNETTPNSRFLALSDYRVKFHGQTAHAAAQPWQGRNALNGAMLALHAIDMLRQHVRPETRIGSYIVNGGTASNIVPDYAELECCIRHTQRAYLDTVIEKVMNCFKGAAIATETTYDVEEWGYAFDDMIWNDAATDVVRQVLRDMEIPFQEERDGGSSDIGNVSHQCPAIHVELAMGDTFYPGHSRQIADMVKDKAIEPIIVKGAAIMGRTILKIAADEAIRKAIAQEFATAVNG